MKKILIDLYLKAKDMCDFIKNDFIAQKFMRQLIVHGAEESIELILTQRASMCRYGDGEFSLMQGVNLKFQKYSLELERELKSIINSREKDIVVCIPDVFRELDQYITRAEKYWAKYLHTNRYNIYKLIDRKKEYWDTQITRFYVDYKDKSMMDEKVKKLRAIWKEQDILIVEGEKSRLGMGNDLFDNVSSIERIVCPAINAYEKIDKIENGVMKNTKQREKLILIALGPTATVLAYRLARRGYWALDIGHIDIEYEWYLKGVEEKCPIANKYIGEIPNGDVVGDNIDGIYNKQIIERIS